MTIAEQAAPRSRGAELLAAARTVIPGGVNSATRLVGAPHALTAASGAHVTDADGRRYLDYHAAFGAILLGHAAPDVDDAVRAAIGDIDLFGWGITEPEIELARLIVETIPSAEQMISAMSGTEATAQAVRLSRAVTGRPLIVKFQGGFHGWHDAVARNVISAPDRAYGD